MAWSNTNNLLYAIGKFIAEKVQTGGGSGIFSEELIVTNPVGMATRLKSYAENSTIESAIRDMLTQESSATCKVTLDFSADNVYQRAEVVTLSKISFSAEQTGDITPVSVEFYEGTTLLGSIPITGEGCLQKSGKYYLGSCTLATAKTYNNNNAYGSKLVVTTKFKYKTNIGNEKLVELDTSYSWNKNTVFYGYIDDNVNDAFGALSAFVADNNVPQTKLHDANAFKAVVVDKDKGLTTPVEINIPEGKKARVCIAYPKSFGMGIHSPKQVMRSGPCDLSEGAMSLDISNVAKWKDHESTDTRYPKTFAEDYTVVVFGDRISPSKGGDLYTIRLI